jgi:hypothetical protein
MRLSHMILISLPMIFTAAYGKAEGAENLRVPDTRPTDEPNKDQMTPPDKVIDKSLIDDVQTGTDGPESVTPPPAEPAPPASPPSISAPVWTWAVGTNLAWSFREDYGSRTFRRFEPEVVGYWYMNSGLDKLWLRHGARVSYSDAQPQMPKAVRMEEYDWKASIEEGLVWSSIVAPSLTFGIGRDWRTIKVKAKPPVTSVDSRLNSKDDFLWMYAQAGLGIPLLNGKILIEPALRRQYLAHDARTVWAAGVELTVAW